MPNKYWQLCFLPVCYALNNMLFKPDIFWGMNLVPRFMACFIIGRVLFDRKKVRMNALLMLLIAVLLLYLVISPRVVGYIAAAVGFEQWKDLLRGLCGLVACAAVAQAVPLKALSVAGRSTMGILVTHKAFVMAVQLVPFHVHSRILAVILVMGETAFALTGALVLTVSLRRICPWIIGESK